jgi:hypothetical protein
MGRLRLSLAVFLLAFGPGCARDGSATQYTVVSGDLSVLRSRFNVDQGKVRAIFLASPT